MVIHLKINMILAQEKKYHEKLPTGCLYEKMWSSISDMSNKGKKGNLKQHIELVSVCLWGVTECKCMAMLTTSISNQLSHPRNMKTVKTFLLSIYSGLYSLCAYELAPIWKVSGHEYFKSKNWVVHYSLIYVHLQVTLYRDLLNLIINQCVKGTW